MKPKFHISSSFKNMEKNIQTWGFVVLGVIIAAILYFGFGQNNQRPYYSMSQNQVTNQQPESSEDVVGTGVAPMSYATALAQYADRRIQLDPSCQAYPSTATYKDNTSIMIDNRSPNTRTVKVDSTFIIKPWGFKIVTLSDVTTKPKTIYVDCDGSQNVATILIQE